MQLQQEHYWLLPGSGRTYRILPNTQISGQPIPTTWAGVGPGRAKELGAVECRRDMLPPFHSIPEGVDPWTEERQHGLAVFRLDIAKLAYDTEAASAAVGKTLRRERNTHLAESDKFVLAIERRIRLGRKAGDDVTLLQESLTQWDTYREALCALPESPGFPNNVQWPERPE